MNRQKFFKKRVIHFDDRGLEMIKGDLRVRNQCFHHFSLLSPSFSGSFSPFDFLAYKEKFSFFCCILKTQLT